MKYSRRRIAEKFESVTEEIMKNVTTILKLTESEILERDNPLIWCNNKWRLLTSDAPPRDNLNRVTLPTFIEALKAKARRFYGGASPLLGDDMVSRLYIPSRTVEGKKQKEFHPKMEKIVEAYETELTRIRKQVKEEESLQAKIAAERAAANSASLQDTTAFLAQYYEWTKAKAQTMTRRDFVKGVYDPGLKTYVQRFWEINRIKQVFAGYRCILFLNVVTELVQVYSYQLHATHRRHAMLSNIIVDKGVGITYPSADKIPENCVVVELLANSNIKFLTNDGINYKPEEWETKFWKEIEDDKILKLETGLRMKSGVDYGAHNWDGEEQLGLAMYITSIDLQSNPANTVKRLLAARLITELSIEKLMEQDKKVIAAWCNDLGIDEIDQLCFEGSRKKHSLQVLQKISNSIIENIPVDFKFGEKITETELRNLAAGHYFSCITTKELAEFEINQIYTGMDRIPENEAEVKLKPDQILLIAGSSGFLRVAQMGHDFYTETVIRKPNSVRRRRATCDTKIRCISINVLNKEFAVTSEITTEIIHIYCNRTDVFNINGTLKKATELPFNQRIIFSDEDRDKYSIPYKTEAVMVLDQHSINRLIVLGFNGELKKELNLLKDRQILIEECLKVRNRAIAYLNKDPIVSDLTNTQKLLEEFHHTSKTMKSFGLIELSLSVLDIYAACVEGRETGIISGNQIAAVILDKMVEAHETAGGNVADNLYQA